MSNHNSRKEEEVVHTDDDNVQSQNSDGEIQASESGQKPMTETGSDDNNDYTNDYITQEPPLPNEIAPPLPHEDDGWDPIWDPNAQAYYFYNRFTQESQWTNPRVPEAQPTAPPGVGNYDRIASRPPGILPSTTLDTIPSAASGTVPSTAPGSISPQPSNDPSTTYGGYNPAIHGDYDPTAPYAQPPSSEPILPSSSAPDLPSTSTVGQEIYTATGVFNRFTGKWQPHDINPENHNDENKSRRQMSAFFDVDAAANSHDGKSLKAERAGKKLSKAEVKAFREKRKERKEERRRAWLRD